MVKKSDALKVSGENALSTLWLYTRVTDIEFKKKQAGAQTNLLLLVFNLDFDVA